ncbi:uncharacterized protein LOC126901440 [Daktulosphaira vitifoliae]|uniref:uncharacterized protein LOC126901440 n=1 Tax=Daktulosphaira vitifoliae TaxID=58002 RepID=UPI0021AA7249|nr:uncharacterized protein LOC126901440 [Daktulosphaira vitifoliae]
MFCSIVGVVDNKVLRKLVNKIFRNQNRIMLLSNCSSCLTIFCVVVIAFSRSNACDHNKDPVACLKIKAIAALDRVSRTDNIPLMDSLSLIRREDSHLDRSGKAITENDLEAVVKQTEDHEAKHEKLNQMFYDSVAQVINSYVVKIGFPNLTSEQLRSSIEEGRGKMKKTMGMMMTGIAMKAMMVIPLALGLLFLMAGKAMIISKIALILSLIITLKKLLSKSSEHVVHDAHSTAGWATGGSAGGYGSGWDKRSSSIANQMAYNSYKS